MREERDEGPAPSIGVVISTYNNPAWLEKTLWGYARQSQRAFELIVADDGSGDETRALLERFAASCFPGLKHVWHPDDGFQKTKILNKALLAAKADYLIFTDQDCVPRADFVERHQRGARRGHFLSGGYLRLPLALSQRLGEEEIGTEQAFAHGWLRANGLPLSLKNLKLLRSERVAHVMNTLTPTRASWNGCNASGWRSDLLAAKGFDERMKYGGEDRELGERLENAGITGLQLRYSLLCLHLEHSRPYRNLPDLEANRAIRAETRATRRTVTAHGLP